MLLRCVNAITVAASTITIMRVFAILVAVTTVATKRTVAACGIEGMLQVQ